MNCTGIIIVFERAVLAKDTITPVLIMDFERRCRSYRESKSFEAAPPRALPMPDTN